jgi:hypothetical protein
MKEPVYILGGGRTDGGFQLGMNEPSTTSPLRGSMRECRRHGRSPLICLAGLHAGGGYVKELVSGTA